MINCFSWWCNLYFRRSGNRNYITRKWESWQIWCCGESPPWIIIAPVRAPPLPAGHTRSYPVSHYSHLEVLTSSTQATPERYSLLEVLSSVFSLGGHHLITRGWGGLEFLNWSNYLYHILSAELFFLLFLKHNIYFTFCLFLNFFSVHKAGYKTRLIINLEAEKLVGTHNCKCHLILKNEAGVNII